MKRLTILLLGAALVLPGAASWGAERDSARDVKNATGKPFVRGGIVFKTYCKVCHGQAGDGNVKANKLYGKDKLVIKPAKESYYRDIINKGGKEMKKSEFMPPWREELSDEQINDVVAYLSVISDRVGRGEVVFNTNCILCHGVKGDGKGRAAGFYDPPPANLSKSNKNEDYMRSIITLGGKAMGRSAAMPVWGEQISAEEIEDVLVYVRKVLMKD